MTKSILINRLIKFNNIDQTKSNSTINSMTIQQKSIIKKPNWIKVKVPSNELHIQQIKNKIKKNGLHSVCEEASCPNLTECFNRRSVTFMILGSICTRKCPFCNVRNGRPLVPDHNEPLKLAETISELSLNYVVITSVNRDDLHDGGAEHFVKCIAAIRSKNKNIKIEILVPDFRGCLDEALNFFSISPPDIFNHNLENVPRLYHNIRPGSNYKRSLKLLAQFKKLNPNIPTKSGLMVGLGETKDEIIKVMHDLRDHGVTMLTIGQYLQPSLNHLPVKRYITPDEFQEMKFEALSMGFTNAACGVFVRSSYFADIQERQANITIENKY